MPMNTTLVTGGLSSGSQPSCWLASHTWPTMSAADRLRLKPCLPVAQKAQSIAQPTWLEMHSVRRAGSGMNTVSMAWPPSMESIHLRVPSAASCSERIVGGRISAISASRVRKAFEMSVMASKSDTP